MCIQVHKVCDAALIMSLHLTLPSIVKWDKCSMCEKHLSEYPEVIVAKAGWKWKLLVTFASCTLCEQLMFHLLMSLAVSV